MATTHSHQEIVTCAVVRAELLHGALKYGLPAQRSALVRNTLAPFRSLPFDDTATDHYARVRHELERIGKPIGPNDLIIAAICLIHDCILVTANIGEFGRVHGLRIEDWSTVQAI